MAMRMAMHREKRKDDLLGGDGGGDGLARALQVLQALHCSVADGGVLLAVHAQLGQRRLVR